MFDADERAALEVAEVGRLATADADGRPNVIPVCFATVEGDDGQICLVTPIDEKPQAVEAEALRRVRDIHVNPSVALIVDHYSDAWDRLGWVQVRASARLLQPGGGGHARAVSALRSRYDQYADHDLEARPMILIEPTSVRSWGELSSLTG